jgi:uncharacterized membrane protein
MFTRKYAKAIMLSVALMAFSGDTAAKPTEFTTIDYPGALHTYAQGNNAAGDVVGNYYDTSYALHGFLLRNGEFSSFDYPGAIWTDVYGINPQGDIVGQYGWVDAFVSTTRGFLLRNGDFFSIDIAGQQNTMPYKINPSGTIVGCNHFNVNNNGGVVTATMTGFSLDSFGNASSTSVRSMNLGINPAGDIVGYSFTTPAGDPSGRAERSYLLRDGVMNWFQYPNAYATLATDISPNGTIVGRYRLLSPATVRGFVLREGQFESFDVPGAALTVPYGVNAKGDIVGYYAVVTGSQVSYHGFLRH